MLFTWTAVCGILYRACFLDDICVQFKLYYLRSRESIMVSYIVYTTRFFADIIPIFMCACTNCIEYKFLYN